jgi:hypothetical protein
MVKGRKYYDVLSFHHRGFVISTFHHRTFDFSTRQFRYFDISLSHFRVFRGFELRVCHDGPNETPLLKQFWRDKSIHKYIYTIVSTADEAPVLFISISDSIQLVKNALSKIIIILRIKI